VVGHTADDQVETVLMHLLRGAGLEGLKGMEAWQVPNAWSKEIVLARPLLGMWREEIAAYCKEHGLQPMIDQSNFERTYFRNRLRHEVIPMLETHSPRLKEKLVRLAEVLRGDLQILEPAVEIAWRESLRQAGDGYVAFNRKELNEQLVGMQRRLVRKAMDRLRPGLRDIGFETVERAVVFLKQPVSRGQVDLASGLRLVGEGETVWVATWEADLPGLGWPKVRGEPVRLTGPGSVSLEDGWQLDLDEVLDVEEGKRLAYENSDPYQTWLDADQFPGELEVRSRNEGDRIKPLGMKGRSVKMSDLMVNVKMPRRARAGWPLICCLDEVLWVPGYATSHTSRVQSETRRIFHIRLVRQA
jgi:tRNA(Ile)-lysidine synthase